MKNIFIAFVLMTISYVTFSQDNKKIILSLVCYTENDSAYFNTNIPESHHSYDNFDLYYRFEGDSKWQKVRKSKKLTSILSANEVSSQQAKKYKRKKLLGKIIVIGGLAGGAVLAATVSPLGGIALILASGATGIYKVSKADKHLFEAIHLYNESLKKL